MEHKRRFLIVILIVLAAIVGTVGLSVVLMLMTTLMIALYRKISGVKDLEGLV